MYSPSTTKREISTSHNTRNPPNDRTHNIVPYERHIPPTQARQLRLKHFEFTCACPLCQNDTDEETRRIEAHLHNPLKAGIKLTELEEIYTLMESLGIAAGKHKVASRGVVLAERNQDSASAKIWLKRRSADARVEDREVIVERAAKLGLLEGTQLTFEAPPDCELGHP